MLHLIIPHGCGCLWAIVHPTVPTMMQAGFFLVLLPVPADGIECNPLLLIPGPQWSHYKTKAPPVYSTKCNPDETKVSYLEHRQGLFIEMFFTTPITTKKIYKGLEIQSCSTPKRKMPNKSRVVVHVMMRWPLPIRSKASFANSNLVTCETVHI